MTLEEIKKSEWYKGLPQIIKDTIEVVPPLHLYRIKRTDKQCFIISYDEPESGKLEDVTITVQKTGKGGVMKRMGLKALDTNQVFGYKPNDLEPWAE